MRIPNSTLPALVLALIVGSSGDVVAQSKSKDKDSQDSRPAIFRSSPGGGATKLWGKLFGGEKQPPADPPGRTELPVANEGGEAESLQRPEQTSPESVSEPAPDVDRMAKPQPAIKPLPPAVRGVKPLKLAPPPHWGDVGDEPSEVNLNSSKPRPATAQTNALQRLPVEPMVSASPDAAVHAFQPPQKPSMVVLSPTANGHLPADEPEAVQRTSYLADSMRHGPVLRAENQKPNEEAKKSRVSGAAPRLLPVPNSSTASELDRLELLAVSFDDLSAAASVTPVSVSCTVVSFPAVQAVGPRQPENRGVVRASHSDRGDDATALQAIASAQPHAIQKAQGDAETRKPAGNRGKQARPTVSLLRMPSSIRNPLRHGGSGDGRD